MQPLKKQKIRPHRDTVDIVLDSRDRDPRIYPNPADYVLPLPSPLRGVKHIELMSIQMTRTEPTVNAGNRQFVYRVDGNDYTIALPMNDYGTNETDCLVRALKKALRLVRPTVDVRRTDTLQLQLQDTVPFSLTLNQATAQLFGLPWTPSADPTQTLNATLNNGVYTLTGTRAMDLSGVPYLILYVNEFTRIMSPSTPLHRAYMLIPMESRRYMDRFLIANDEKEKKSKYKLTDPQRTLSQFRIRFTRPDGTLYDFNGVNHHIIFKISYD